MFILVPRLGDPPITAVDPILPPGVVSPKAVLTRVFISLARPQLPVRAEETVVRLHPRILLLWVHQP